jgi:CRISPR-associated protein Csm3
MSDWKLLEIKRISGKLRVITGLRVGASTDTMEIAGNDNPIIRSPITGMPYLPGSSIKGKMRSLAEWFCHEIPSGGDPIKATPESRTSSVFGISAERQREIGPTRLIVRDAELTGEGQDKFRKGEPITETKHENSINRLTAMANPRPMERVVPGVEFDVSLVFKIIDRGGDGGNTDRENYANVLLPAMALLEADYLGSAGSRGCGQIKFVNLEDEQGNEIALPDLRELMKKAAG